MCQKVSKAGVAIIVYLFLLSTQYSCTTHIVPSSQQVLTAEALNSTKPKDFPGEIYGITEASGQGEFRQVSRTVCVVFPSKLFWQPGDFWYKSDDLPQVVIILDSNVLDIAWKRFGPQSLVTDKTGVLIGAHGGELQACFVKELKPGEHNITLRALKEDKEVVSIAWGFKIVD